MLARVRRLLSKNDAAANVAATTLEFSPRPLPEEIAAVARARAAETVRVLPLFLHAGTHVRDDLPLAVAAARKSLGGRVAVELLPFLGSHPEMADLVCGQFTSRFSGGRALLVAHGSRRPGGNEVVATMAASLSATLAFWAIAPDLETQVAALAAAGDREIAVAPYFLFPGSITDALANRVDRLQEVYPSLSLAFAGPLHESPALALLICNLCCEPCPS